jgi:Colicin-E5 Imm protein
MEVRGLMGVDRRELYDSAAAFFEPAGNVVMQLTPEAAMNVCLESASRHFLVLGIEGGIHKDGRFAPRGDCIWSGDETARDDVRASENNQKAAQFIKDNSVAHNSFLVTVVPVNRPSQPRHQ